MGYLENITDKWNGKSKEDTTFYPVIGKETELRLELANICNHACLFCPNHKMQRKKKEMEKELVLRLISEGGVLGIRKLGLFMNGEPFITKELPYYISQAKKIGYHYVYITTNGSLATEEKIKACAEAGIDSIKFSINAGSRETYKIVHQKDDYNKVIENLKNTYKFRQEHGYQFKILSSFVVTKYTIQEMKEHYQKIKPYVDELVFFNAESFAGQMQEEVSALRVEIEENIPKHKINNQAPCKALWNSLNVTCEGFLTLCCSEAFNYLAVEDLNQMGLKEAWYSERMIAIRKRHMENKLEGTQCGKCLGSWDGEVNPLNQELFNPIKEVPRF